MTCRTDYRPSSLDEVDVGLEEAIDDLRRYCTRLPHGRVTLVVDRFDRSTIAHHLDVDRLTTADVERVMREPPHKTREGKVWK